MEIIINGNAASGKVDAPSSKSQTHRAFICSLMCDGTSNIRRPLICDDTTATIEACKQFGAEIEITGKHAAVSSHSSLEAPSGAIDCGESASTLRMMMAPSALFRGNTTFTGKEGLLRRPIKELVNAMEGLGVRSIYKGREGFPPVEVIGGGIKGGKISIRGDISSQYISSLLLALPGALRESTIEVRERFESMPYVQMTLDVMEEFGITVEAAGDLRHLRVPNDQGYRPSKVGIEGDFSSAAFLMAAGCLGGEVSVGNLDHGSKQGDKAIVGILQAMGANMEIGDDHVVASKSELRAIDLNCSQIPDLVPIIAVLCSQARGISILRNLGRLKIKESDRVSAISTELIKMGADIEVSDDTMRIRGKRPLEGTALHSHNDHRIAMSLIVASLSATGYSTMSGTKCISKSYPSFLDDMNRLGVDIDVL